MFGIPLYGCSLFKLFHANNTSQLVATRLPASNISRYPSVGYQWRHVIKARPIHLNQFTYFNVLWRLWTTRNNSTIFYHLVGLRMNSLYAGICICVSTTKVNFVAPFIDNDSSLKLRTKCKWHWALANNVAEDFLLFCFPLRFS